MNPAARAAAFDRSAGVCQLCGQAPATEAHHWAGTPLAGPYPPDSALTAADLTALCGICHEIATTLRRFHRHGGDRFSFMRSLKEAVERCDMKSTSRVRAQSSCTTARPDSTRAPLPISKRRKSPERKAATEPKPTTPGSANSNAKPVFGSTRKERRQSRKAPFEACSKPPPGS